nr:IQ motif and SEC7 domain-containing protein 3 isoform X2 [Bactrocera oleae]XP_036216451.1 IQ motif and SEC7 domain-containing protein 3 isoform X2 [Bactrocera oleae]XP_036216452.1 IQ motif and SEC7 domain-containing protein 3 isoform X2 [Bactrocera oleae]
MSETELYESKGNSESFLQYGNEKPPPIVVVVGDGRSRVRRVVRTATRHVTVVSYSTRHKETRTHTSHHVTTVSFPQKSIERSGSTQYDIAAPPGSTTSGSTMSTDCGGYVYLQQHYIPSSSSSAAINYPVMPQSHMIYQQHHPQQQQQQYTNSCHQQQIAHQSAAAAAAGSGGMHHGQHVSLHHQHHHHHLLHGHHHHHGGAVVIAGSGVGTGGAVGVAGSGGPGSTSPSAMQQNMHKKNSIRNGSDVLKRARAQTAYELSQDLLEKQIELLERKYGGVRARNAAVTIQRAFRHYMMVKKFASITAMAKAEKRLSRRVLIVSGGACGAGAVVGGVEDGPASNSSLSSAYGSATESQLDMMHQQQQQQLQAPGTTSPYANQQSQTQQQQQQPRVTILAGPPGSVVGATSVPIVSSSAMSARTPPTRSLSMRERRQQDGSPIPRSQSGASSVPIGGGGGSSASSTSSGGTLGSATHPHVNLLHATEPHFYGSQHLATHYYHVPPHEASYASSANNSHLDSSLNTSWASVASGTSPHTPYYSAAQIYMRPKGAPGSTSAERKKVPPEVPKRTSSIAAQQHAQHLAAQQQHQHMLMMRQTPPPPSLLRSNGLCKSAENGSLTSVQSSGSDSSVTSADRIAVNSDIGSDRSNSPQTWKRNTALSSSQQFVHNNDAGAVAFSLAQAQAAGMVTDGRGGGSVVGAANTSDDHAVSSHTTAAQYEQHEQQQDHHLNAAAPLQNYKVSETIRKRQYRVGLNLFNKKPEKGITYLIRRGFLENTPQGVARFLISRKGLSRQMIGEYLGNLQNQFNMAVLNCFALELDLSGMQVDVALRKFQAYFRMPGEAQKIERLMEVFSQRFCQCNQDIVGRLRSSDTIFVLAFAIIMLNTDLHTPNLKPERRMRVEDFIKNLRGIDDCHDIEKDMLAGIYERVKANEFKPGSDHVTQVMKVQATIVGKKPNLALPHRRLVCYCRLYEIPDVNKKERPGVHQREVFLFNDLLVITKIFSKKKSSVTYTFRNSFPLCGMVVTLLDVANYPFCIQLSQKVDGKILITFNARNEHDRCKFAEDLKESISEMDEMEALRIEAELERQKSARNRTAGSSENRDSGVADVEVGAYQATPAGELAPNANDPAQQLKRSALSNSLLDMHEQFGNEKPQRRGSVGSLDSGMSISFQSTTTSSASRENAAVIAAAANAAAAKMRFNLPAGGAVAMGGNVGATVVYPNTVGTYAHATAGFVSQPHAILMQQQLVAQQQQQQQQHLQNLQQQPQQAALLLQQQQQQAHAAMQGSITGRVPGSGRERKLSRSDETGRSTEV